jgi:hypothetical protein
VTATVPILHDDELMTPQVGGPGAIIFYAISFALLGTAFWNLWNYDARPVVTLIASVLWLLLVGFLTYYSLGEDGGPKQYLINRLGAFGAKQFVWIERSGGQPDVCFGYRLFGRRFHYLKIQAGQIESVCWNAGQGTALAGRDMNDWNVIVWYKELPNKTGWPRWTPLCPKGLYILGPCGPKDMIARLGLTLVEFLGRTGTVLLPSKDECRYVSEDAAQHEATHTGREEDLSTNLIEMDPT